MTDGKAAAGLRWRGVTDPARDSGFRWIECSYCGTRILSDERLIPQMNAHIFDCRTPRGAA